MTAIDGLTAHPRAAETLGDAVANPKPRSSRDVLASILHKRSADPGLDTRLPTGFEPLDSVLDGGMRPEDLVVLGGKPGVGKTIAMVQWARNMASAGNRVLFASYELSERNLLSRLLMMEVGARTRHLDPQSRTSIARTIRDAVRQGSIGEDGEVRELIRLAYDAIDHYADRLLLQRVSGYHAEPEVLARLSEEWVGAGGVLFVDYLQKVPVKTARDDTERVLKVAESLKEVAMSQSVCVIAAAAVEAGTLGTRRLRLDHLRGSALVAHEADVALAMNEKSTALSKSHLAYDPHLYEASLNKVVFTIEKNREGPAMIHVEFDKEFSEYRFNPNGGYMTQRLVDDIFDEG